MVIWGWMRHAPAGLWRGGARRAGAGEGRGRGGRGRGAPLHSRSVPGQPPQRAHAQPARAQSTEHRAGRQSSSPVSLPLALPLSPVCTRRPDTAPAGLSSRCQLCSVPVASDHRPPTTLSRPAILIARVVAQPFRKCFLYLIWRLNYPNVLTRDPNTPRTRIPKPHRRVQITRRAE